MLKPYNKPILIILVFIGIFMVLYVVSARETFCPNQVFYADAIEQDARSPPFYDLNTPRQPLSVYKNYIMPPPLNYGPYEESPSELEKRYQYWNSSLLSHPQTPYLI